MQSLWLEAPKSGSRKSNPTILYYYQAMLTMQTFLATLKKWWLSSSDSEHSIARNADSKNSNYSVIITQTGFRIPGTVPFLTLFI